MVRFGKVAQIAIAAVSALAEAYDGGKTTMSSADNAKRRELPQPIVAKVLTILSTKGVVAGTRGPGGGYWLNRKPNRVSLFDIVGEFERTDTKILCPFGPNWCGNGEPCPMHDSLQQRTEDWEAYLKQTKFDIFRLSGSA